MSLKIEADLCGRSDPKNDEQPLSDPAEFSGPKSARDHLQTNLRGHSETLGEPGRINKRAGPKTLGSVGLLSFKVRFVVAVPEAGHGLALGGVFMELADDVEAALGFGVAVAEDQ